jgi:hypothetical protein
MARAAWSDQLNDKFGLKFLHPDFEAELNGTFSTVHLIVELFFYLMYSYEQSC